jgi:ribosomal protein RSM22 (predicted rRNA methylase)
MSLPTPSPSLRKHRLAAPLAPRAMGSAAEIDLQTRAEIYYTSETPEHPIERMLDGSRGPGATFWASEQPDTEETILLKFDEPTHVAAVVFEVEESERERTQEVRAEYSTDDGAHYRGLFVQEYNFSPQGSTFQSETLAFDLHHVTHIRLAIKPNKRGSGRATLTSLRVLS